MKMSLEDIRVRWDGVILKHNLKNTVRSYMINHHLDEFLLSLDSLRHEYNISWNEFKKITPKEVVRKENRYLNLQEIKIGWEKIVKKYNLADTCESYQENYKLDSRLPSWFKIYTEYKIGWKEFKEENTYSLKQIQEIWKNLVSKYSLKNTSDSYNENYKLDPRLPSFNYVSYKYGISWKQFLGKSEKPRDIHIHKDKYQSLEENLEGWLNLVDKYGLKNTLNSYRQNFHLDNKLYCIDSIFKLYSTTWKEFIGTKQYNSLKDIRKAWLILVSKYGFSDREPSYSENYKRDEMLPSIAFLNKFNISWKEFKNIK